MKLSDRLDHERLLRLAFRARSKGGHEPTPNQLLVEAGTLWLIERDHWFLEWTDRIALRWPALLLAQHEECFERVDELDARYFEEAIATGEFMTDEDEIVTAAAMCLVVRLFWRIFNAGQVSDIVDLTQEDAAAWIERNRLAVPEATGQMRLL